MVNQAARKSTGKSSPRKQETVQKKSKKRAVEEEEEVPGDMPERDEEAEAAGQRRKEKKQKKKKDPEPEPEEEEEAEEEGDEEDEVDEGTVEERVKAKLRRQRLHKKIAGYRTVAKACGFNKKAGVIAASGIDSHASFLTEADAKRLMRFFPEVLNKSSYDKEECQERMKLSTESVPGSAARVTQAHCQAVMRHIMNQATLRTVEKGAMRIDAATMYSVIRPYQYGMTFSGALPPKGLIRHAQNEGKLSSTTADEAAIDTEKTENNELVASQKKIDKAEETRKTAFMKRKAELAAARIAAA